MKIRVNKTIEKRKNTAKTCLRFRTRDINWNHVSFKDLASIQNPKFIYSESMGLTDIKNFKNKIM